jgi:hypothetical protein
VVDGSVSMTNVTATATGGTNNRGVHNVSSSPSMMNVTATATATGTGTGNNGVQNYNSSPSMTNVTATGTGTDNVGVYNNSSSSPSVRNSSITGTKSIWNTGGSSAQVADTMLDGTVAAGSGLACVGVYDEAFVALDASCS